MTRHPPRSPLFPHPPLSRSPPTPRATRAILRPPMAPSAPASLTAVPGVSVGHWTDLDRATGCSVVLGPDGGMRAACAVRGRATGTREIDALNPRHLVDRIDAILLTGGSAYGLGAADGVMRWLKERGRGLPVGSAGIVPIVPTAVIFDFDLAPGGKADRWPTADDAYRACSAASGGAPRSAAWRRAIRRLPWSRPTRRSTAPASRPWPTPRATRWRGASFPTALCSTAMSSSR